MSGPQVLVQVEAGVEVAALAAARGLSVVGRFGQRPIYRLQLPAGGDAERVAASLRGVSGVVFAEPNVDSETPEGRRNTFWAIGNSAQDYVGQWAPATLRLAQAHAVTTGTGVRVAVLDTGLETTHPAFAGRLARRADGRLLGRDFVDGDDDPSERGSVADAGFGHGTHVAALVALAAPGATLMPVRVLDPAGTGNAWVLAEALAWAVDPDGDPRSDDGAHVVNLSLGSTRPTRMLEIARTRPRRGGGLGGRQLGQRRRTAVPGRGGGERHACRHRDDGGAAAGRVRELRRLDQACRAGRADRQRGAGRRVGNMVGHVDGRAAGGRRRGAGLDDAREGPAPRRRRPPSPVAGGGPDEAPRGPCQAGVRRVGQADRRRRRGHRHAGAGSRLSLRDFCR
ncbi:MAG: S8 family serine peptidase, partial [Burkholderiaceae bacterium]|nr:S8 family serine peptidase [Burkholderiaceae bacterium]